MSLIDQSVDNMKPEQTLKVMTRTSVNNPEMLLGRIEESIIERFEL